jgi:hypothetical protein
MRGESIPGDGQLLGDLALRVSEEVHHLWAVPGYQRKWKFHWVIPAIAESSFQLKFI